MQIKSVVIAGASGLVGGALLSHLLTTAEIDAVWSLGRKQLPVHHPKLSQWQVDFLDLAKSPDIGPDRRLDTVFCCLGTTMKKAGSKEQFNLVDHDFPLALATWAKARGANRFLLVSALGANPKSTVFYNRIKGEVEQALGQVGFKTVQIVRPSMLAGDRSEFRLKEVVGLKVMKLMSVVLPANIRAVDADVVARAMLHLAFKKEEGVRIYQSGALAQLAKSLP